MLFALNNFLLLFFISCVSEDNEVIVNCPTILQEWNYELLGTDDVQG